MTSLGSQQEPEEWLTIVDSMGDLDCTVRSGPKKPKVEETEKEYRRPQQASTVPMPQGEPGGVLKAHPAAVRGQADAAERPERRDEGGSRVGKRGKGRAIEDQESTLGAGRSLC